MRIGTWNLDARWDDRHLQLICEQDCDAWLLTEVSDRVSLPGFAGHATVGRMSRQQHWAAVFLRAGSPVVEPDPATAAMVTADGLTFWSSVLPWPSCGPRSPWSGESHDDRVRAAVHALRSQRVDGDLVWGGDWNHSLAGRVVGSRAGRAAVVDLVDVLGLQVPTVDLPHQLVGVQSIDHVGVPASWDVRGSWRVPAVAGGKTLSDHDLYIVDVFPR